VNLLFSAEKNIQRNKTYITNEIRHPGPSRSLRVGNTENI